MMIVSACLLGDCCKYTGGHNYDEAVLRLTEGKQTCRVCPEVEGGLAVPRPASEIFEDRVLEKEGGDVTEAFLDGAKRSLELAEQKAAELNEPIEAAILKARSPSCGSNIIYDGTFSGRKVIGDGCFAALLKEKGIRVITEVEL